MYHDVDFIETEKVIIIRDLEKKTSIIDAKFVEGKPCS